MPLSNPQGHSQALTKRSLKNLQGATLLVTGAAGFIGFHLCHTLLSLGFTVVGVDNLNDYYDVRLKQDRLKQLQTFSSFHFHLASIQDRATMEMLWAQYPDIRHVVHLAAQAGVRYSLQNPYTYIESNVMGHLVMLELCRHRPYFQHLIYASSSSVYGGNDVLPFSVDDRCDRPISLYAATKKADELITQSYAYLFQLPTTGFRFFTAYGPWGRPDMAGFIFVKSILEGRPIPVFNYGKMERDFTYIDDIIDGILGALENPPVKADATVPHRVYNLGCHRSENLMEFIQLIEDCLGIKAVYDLQPLQEGDVPCTYADIDSAQRDLGFEPRTSIQKGIPKFIDWYRKYYQI